MIFVRFTLYLLAHLIITIGLLVFSLASIPMLWIMLAYESFCEMEDKRKKNDLY